MASLTVPLPRDVVAVEKVKHMLAEAVDMDEIRHVMDAAEALRLYYRKADDGLEIQNHAAEVKIRAERRAGELLRQIQRRQRGGDQKSKSQSGTLKLADLGINKNQSSRWQQIAQIPSESFERHIDSTKESGKELTSASTLKLAKRESAVLKSQSCARPMSAQGWITNLDELKGQRFGCLYIDPPWPYENQSSRGATSNHYSAMSLRAVADLPIPDLAAAKSHLHLWTTNAFLGDGIQLIEHWGFSFKSMLIWIKPQIGMGNYWRVSHETLLLGVRGKLTFASNEHRSWISVDRKRHSEKPDQIRDLVQTVSPGPYLELFGRKPCPGWTVWGNQLLTD